MKLKHLLLLLALTTAQTLMAQSETTDIPFNGLIRDKQGNPLKGAKIYVSQNRVARSDKKGRFGLTNVGATDTIHIVYRKTHYDIPVEGRRSLSVRLCDQLEANEDEELVNWGYGYVKRRESLEVSSGISGEELARCGYNNLMDALQSRIPGLNIMTSRTPGVSGEVSIRGRNSLTLDQTPLYVLDGVVVSSLDFLSVYDVERVEVLKEASIYGSRGANGAILVTTKRH